MLEDGGQVSTGGLVSEKLSVNDLSDGRLLCALMVSARALGFRLVSRLLPSASASFR